MLTAFVKGDYRAPWPTLVLLLAAVVYFLRLFRIDGGDGVVWRYA